MASDKDSFGISGPSFLTSIDWNNSYHRRSVAASLIQGVYVLESDRLQNRHGHLALAPPWWESFSFKLHQVLVDDRDQSYLGAIYEFNFPYPYPNYVGQRPPLYVVAFRGKINKSEGHNSRADELKTSLNCMIKNLQEDRAFQIGLESALSLVSRAAGPGHVWLAGHSIGSSIALLIGRDMVKRMSAHVETYLFNPPFASPPIEMIKNEKVKLGLRLASSVLTAGLVVAANGGHTPKSHGNEVFAILSSWVPYLFISSSDMICSEYIGYFEHREKMESIGAGKIERLATKHSIGSIVSSARGKKDSEPVHLLPSAYLTINSTHYQNFKEAHGIHQWWNPDLELKYKLYQYK